MSRSDLEAWLAQKGLGGDAGDPADAVVNALAGTGPICGATRRKMFLDAVYMALEDDPLLQEDGEVKARQTLKQAKERLQKLDESLSAVDTALAAVLDDPNAVLGLHMTQSFDYLLRLRLSFAQASVNMALQTVTSKPGRPQIPVDSSIGYMAEAWRLCFGKKPSPEKGSQFHAFIDQLSSMELIRIVSESTLRRILS